MKSGENLLTLVRAMQRLHSEVAALLKTFEKLAGEQGYFNHKDKSVSNGCSYSIDTSEQWMMPWMFRHLQKKGNVDDVVALNIALAPDADVASERNFTEPLVLCARFRYAKGQAKDHAGEWDPWDIWFCGPEKRMGRVYSRTELGLDESDFQAKSGWDDSSFKVMREVAFLAVPLASLKDSKTLREEVINRILG